jgi:hypothetical protein
MAKWHRAIVLLCAAAAFQCEQPKPRPAPVLVLVFDPTIYETGDATAVSGTLERLRPAFAALPFRTCVHVIIARESAASVGSDYNRCFRNQGSFGSDSLHTAALSASFDTIAGMMMESWNRAHQTRASRRASSCLITSILRGARAADEEGTNSEGVTKHLVVFSNMLEACSDWHINMEREIPDAPDLSGDMDLSDFSSIVLAQAGSSHLRAGHLPQVEQFWRTALTSGGAGEQAIRFSYSIPASLLPASGVARAE